MIGILASRGCRLLEHVRTSSQWSNDLYMKFEICQLIISTVYPAILWAPDP
jgi:hypothetical protein